MNKFTWSRVFAILDKELTQLRRDRATFSVLLAMPLIQLLMYGYALNGDPHHIKTAVLIQDEGPFARSILAAMNNSAYFDVVAETHSPAQLDRLMAVGDAPLTVTIPADFTRRVVRHEHAQILVEADASDPISIGSALGAIASLPTSALAHDLTGPLASPQSAPPFEAVVHRRYNPENITAYNIVPGMLAIILSMTLVMMTSSSLTREREQGTMEILLATSVRPIEVMIGKLTPYVIVGVVQAVIILVFSRVLFNIPMSGGWDALGVGMLFFITGSLSLGFFISAISRTQRAAQMIATFYFMPSMMLSGFMYPFSGMPVWAQWIGTLVPITHFLRVVRGAVLKGYGISESWHSIAALGLFMVVISALAISRYRTTLD
jgi:ABC-2 type transport system permease protein